MVSPGGKFSVNKFYNTLRSMAVKCTKNSLYDYLVHLVDAFVFSKAPLHTRSEKVRLINPAKIYTIDTGLLNAMTFRNSSDYGPLLENVVYDEETREIDLDNLSLTENTRASYPIEFIDGFVGRA